MDCDIYGCGDSAVYKILVYKKRRLIFLPWFMGYVRRYNLCKPHERQIEGLMASLQLMVKDREEPQRLDKLSTFNRNENPDH